MPVRVLLLASQLLIFDAPGAEEGPQQLDGDVRASISFGVGPDPLPETHGELSVQCLG